MTPETAACLHPIFEAQADRRPAAPAIVSGDDTATYVEVERRANQLARHLRARGVRARDLVGLYLERSPDAVVAILAILKAGAAYVPLDPGHPGERVRHILAEAGIRVLVSDSQSAALAAELGDAVVLADDPLEPWRGESTARLSLEETGVRPEDLSYVLYTSGSTGWPKGVMTEHRNAARFVAAFNQVIRLTEADRVFQGFSLSFDGSVEEMWMAFSNGGALVVPPRGSARFGNDLAAILVRERVTVFSTVPTSLSMISDPLASVRLLIVSGEPCTRDVVRRWATPRRRLLNVYGPTETTVNATAAECRPDREVSIGRPLPGYEAHLLDERGAPVAPGTPGELYIGGPGVARGYLNQPELTEKHFVRLPTSEGEDARRLYRTGDLASLGPEGELLFHGRIDQQVKIRGFRVELSEIEAVLAQHEAIRSAVVSVVDRDGNRELAAYVVAADRAAAIDRGDLLARLASRLPSYMVPAFLDVLPELPLLASGKVDRKRLPPPVAPFVRAERPIRAPRNELEADLLQAFTVVFKNDAISIDDDFFRTLGGYSLLAARLVSGLRGDLGYDVAIREVYEHPTIEALAACVQAKGGRPASQTRAIDGERHGGEPASRRSFDDLSPWVRRGCALLQLATLYVVYGLMAAPFVGWLLPWQSWRAGALSTTSLVAVWAVVAAGTWPALLALSVAVKWLVIGRYRPGAYPLWGSYYFRCWLVRRFELLASPGLLAGTPLLPLYLRLMGAKVGRNCTIDTPHIAIFDLLTIGDHTCIGGETQLLGYAVEDGLFRVGSIDIGERCFIGIHAALGLDVRMENGSRLDDLSLLPDGARVAPGQGMRGSPAVAAEVAVPAGDAASPSAWRRALFGVLHALTIYGVGVALLPSAAPGVALVGWAERAYGTAGVVLALPVAAVVAMVSFCLWIPVLKWTLLPRLRPGVYRVDSFLYLRKWAVDLLIYASRNVARPLYTTIYLPPWLRLLGAKIGRRAEISTVSQISPELVDLGEQSFFADGSMIGGRRCHRGLVELRASRVGWRSFVGNSAILPVGASLGDGCLLGCLSAPPAGVNPAPDGTEWLGSPSFALPHRQRVEGYDETLTHEPTRTLIAQRLVVDALRIVIPCVLGAAQLALLQAILEHVHARHSLTAFALSVPPAAAASAALGLLGAVLTKRILIGTFRPVVKPLWSMFVWLNEAVNGTYETVAAPLLGPLLGTPFCAPWLRLMGCKIGRNVYLETTLFSEFDLVEIGDRAALNAGAVVQNHLFEDRIMKASALHIGEDCCVGGMAVVLYDTEMQAGSAIGPLSLLMKGEILPPRTRWLGIPTAQVPAVVAALAAPEPASDREPTLVEGWS